MLGVTCPWPCSLALGRVGCHHQRPRVCLLREYSAQRPQQRRSAVPSYQEILREGHVKALCELARNVAKRASPAHIVRESRRQGEVLVKKLFTEDSSIEDVHLSAQQTTETVHALSALGSHRHFEREMEMLLQNAAREVEQFTPASTIQLLYSAAKASHHSDALAMLVTSQRLLDDLPAILPQPVGKLLWALAVLNLKPRALLDRLQATMAATVGVASGSMLLHFCWTLAVLEQAGSEAFKLPWRALSQKQPKEIGFSTHDATAFCQVVEELHISGQGCQISAGHLALYERYLEVRTEHLQNEKRLVSSLHEDVMTALEVSGTKYDEEALIGIYSVDIALPDYKVAIEVDGPSHFTRTRPKRSLGPTLMKQRHLEGAGWVVVSVCSDDWSAQESWQQKMSLLKDLCYKIEKQRLQGRA